MTRCAWALALGSVLALGLTVVGAPGADKDKDKDKEEDKEAVAAAQKGVLKLADTEANKPADAAKEAAALSKKIEELKYIMKPLALRREGGVGVGGKAGDITPDGIEAKLISISKKEMSAKDLNAQADDLARSADIMVAIADVALAKTPTKKSGEKDPVKWKEFSNNMKDSAKKLSAAAKAKKPADVLDAAQSLYASCTDCHAIWKP